MYSPLPFQFLPPHIVRLIVNHVVGSSRLVFDGVQAGLKAYKMLLKPLLWVSHNFRAVAYLLYCSHFTLTVGDRLSTEPGGPTLHQSCHGLGYSAHHMANRLYINFKERDIYTGAALRVLSQEFQGDCAFPLVHTLTLLLEVYTFKEANELDGIYRECVANINAFVLWVKQMVPMASGIKIEIDGYFYPDNNYDDLHYYHLVSQLYRLSNCITYSCYSRIYERVELVLDETRGLVHISYVGNSAGNQFTHLARQNAQTLQTLYLESTLFEDLDGLFHNPDSSYATYLRLSTLKLEEYTTHGISRRPAFSGAVPFPILRSLRLRLTYPFGDDALFRGNSATLESLVLQADSSLVSVLHQRGVFTPTSHPKLQCVIFEHLGRLVPDTFATYAEGIRFALSIGPSAPVREIDGVPAGDELLPALSLPGSHSSIRVLSIPDTQLDIWQAISLITSLPHLSDLHAPLPNIGPVPDGVTMDELSAYMVSTYAPMGKRFRCWHIEHYTDGIECMILLALICPNFDYVAMDQDERKPFMKALEVSIASTRYRSYAPRLRRLLFNGWQSC